MFPSRHVLSIAVLVWSAAIGAACDLGDDGESGVNAPCTRAKDCRRGLECREGVCTDPDGGAARAVDGPTDGGASEAGHDGG